MSVLYRSANVPFGTEPAKRFTVRNGQQKKRGPQVLLPILSERFGITKMLESRI